MQRMSNGFAPETREQPHKVLAYMVESEAKGFWQTPPEERKGWAYEQARRLMYTFGFIDLIACDLAEEDEHRETFDAERLTAKEWEHLPGQPLAWPSTSQP
jgi:hypothetical protein